MEAKQWVIERDTSWYTMGNVRFGTLEALKIALIMLFPDDDKDVYTMEVEFISNAIWKGSIWGLLGQDSIFTLFNNAYHCDETSWNACRLLITNITK